MAMLKTVKSWIYGIKIPLLWFSVLIMVTMIKFSTFLSILIRTFLLCLYKEILNNHGENHYMILQETRVPREVQELYMHNCIDLQL